jgi:hypothetical protein
VVSTELRAIQADLTTLHEHTRDVSMREVIFCCFSASDLVVHERVPG